MGDEGVGVGVRVDGLRQSCRMPMFCISVVRG